MTRIFLWLVLCRMCYHTLMLKVDIDRLSEEELIELNQKVVARLRFLREMRSHVQMLDFRIGERVGFRPEGQPEVYGFVTRYNKKSVTVITDRGEHWRVAPSLLFKVNTSQTQPNQGEKNPVVVFPKNSR